MRHALLGRLGPGAWLKSSYLPGRSGFLIHSPRSLSLLRQALMPRWACRLYPIHEESGRFFLEPSQAWLSEALRDEPLDGWWNSAHQMGAERFFEPRRSDRVRRLPQATRADQSGGWTHGFRKLRALALRLESLSVTPRPDKHWSALAKSFDELWQGTALYAHPPSLLGEAVFDHLRRCQERCAQGLLGTSTG